MKMRHDDFETWIRERSSGCMETSEIDDLCKGDLDFESGEYTFQNQSVQAQWEAWQAALTNDDKTIESIVDAHWEFGKASSNGRPVPTCSKCGWAINADLEEHEAKCWSK